MPSPYSYLATKRILQGLIQEDAAMLEEYIDQHRREIQHKADITQSGVLASAVVVMVLILSAAAVKISANSNDILRSEIVRLRETCETMSAPAPTE